MSKRIVSIAAAALVAASFAGQAFSAENVSSGRVVVTANRVQAEPNAAYLQYRAAVLGEGSVSTASHRAADSRAPGAFALYQIRNGASASDALARAASLGEQPAYRIVQNDGRVLNAIERNEKRLGNSTLQAEAFTAPVAAR